jgi:sterol desaturase/sphingolipid hydroxylase (fatty acid hydroxylase superfamily)
MTHPTIIHDEEPIRLFKSNFLEFFTHITPVAILVLWVPVVLILLIVPSAPVSFGQALVAFLLGLFIWTLAEYLLHRFVFHFPPKTPRMERITFLFHGVHHTQPQCKTRLVMPPPVSIPLAGLFYGFFWLLFGNFAGVPGWVHPIMAAFMVGYLVYDLTHYATHHFPMRNKAAKFLKRYHMMHHYKTPDARYGVSSPLWDIVFGTMPED